LASVLRLSDGKAFREHIRVLRALLEGERVAFS
jgi:hypothetical protein